MASVQALSPEKPGLFESVTHQDFLQLFDDTGAPKPDEVRRFLELDYNDLSKIAGVSKRSVRFDQRMPSELAERIREIAEVCNLVAEFFDGDASLTARWFKARNPNLGMVSPRDMIRLGRYKRLLQFIHYARAQSGEEEVSVK